MRSGTPCTATIPNRRFCPRSRFINTLLARRLRIREEAAVTLRPQNQRIDIAGEDAIRVLREIELVLVSLHKIGSHYAALEGAGGVR